MTGRVPVPPSALEMATEVPYSAPVRASAPGQVGGVERHRVGAQILGSRTSSEALGVDDCRQPGVRARSTYRTRMAACRCWTGPSATRLTELVFASSVSSANASCSARSFTPRAKVTPWWVVNRATWRLSSSEAHSHNGVRNACLSGLVVATAARNSSIPGESDPLWPDASLVARRSCDQSGLHGRVGHVPYLVPVQNTGHAARHR